MLDGHLVRGPPFRRLGARCPRWAGGPAGPGRHLWRDLLLGRGSGKLRANPRKAWYRNLEKDPNVELQVLDDVFPARARTAEGEERERLWQLVNQQWPDYESYQTKTDREIPVVVLERA